MLNIPKEAFRAYLSNIIDAISDFYATIVVEIAKQYKATHVS